MKRVYFIMCLVLIMSFLGAQELTTRLVFTIPVGDSGLSYSDVDTKEAPSWGPASFDVAEDGTFWFANSVKHELKQYSKTGEHLRTINLKNTIIGLHDISVSKDGIYVLDMAAPKPYIVQVGFSRGIRGHHTSPISLEEGLSGISYVKDSGLIVEKTGTPKILIGKDSRSGNKTLSGYPHGDTTYEVAPFTIKNVRQTYTVKAGNVNVYITTQNKIVGLKILHVTKNGNFYLIVDEMIKSSPIYIDRTIRHYTQKGQLLGISRVPLNERYVPVEFDLAVASDESIYTLITRHEQVEVHKLVFVKELEPLTPPVEEIIEVKEATNTKQERASITREQVIANAKKYLNNSKYLSSKNVSGSCSGRDKPRYIGGAGTYSSVPYDWGGWDSVEQFNSYMSNGYAAGDVRTSGVESCSKGVDCSGFVTRAWGRTDKKYGTSTLNQISNYLSSTSQLLAGDIMNKAGSHVRLFASFSGSGCYCYEATKSKAYDRVVYRYLSWSSYSGYKPARYKYISGSTPPPPPPSGDWPTHSRTVNSSGHNVYAIQYLLRYRGYSVTVNGSYDYTTESKIKALYSSSNGVVNEYTWKYALIKTFSKGSKGDGVKAIQYLLARKFGYGISIDGDFGPATQSAVIQFQRSKGLSTDGVVGPNTWKALVNK